MTKNDLKSVMHDGCTLGQRRALASIMITIAGNTDSSSVGKCDSKAEKFIGYIWPQMLVSTPYNKLTVLLILLLSMPPAVIRISSI